MASIYEAEWARQRARAHLPPGHLPVHRWYLRMERPDERASPAPRDGLAVIRAGRPTVAFYRFLYHTAGEEWLWGDRRRMDDETLAAKIGRATTHIMVLYRDGTPAGFYELDDAAGIGGEEAVALNYFALLPHAIGGGLGSWMLDHAIADAGSRRRPLLVDTCSLDHPHALENYRARGFAIHREEDEIYPDPRLDGTIRRDAGSHVPLASR